MAKLCSYRESDERYPVLRFMVGLFVGLGSFAFVIAVGLIGFGGLSLGAGLVDKNPLGPWAIVVLVYGAGGFLLGLQFLVVSSLLRLAIHVEENTRISAQCLEKIRDSLAPREVSNAPLFRS